MRTPTAVAIFVVLATLGGAVVAGVFGVPGVGSESVPMAERWVSDTARAGDVNHHSPAAGRVDGRPMVFAPISDGSDARDCALVALRGDTAAERWQHPVTGANCIVHAIADPTIADYDGDGGREVLVATTENALLAFEAGSGERELRYDLDAYGYTKPVVTDLTGDGENEIVVVDARGTAYAVRPNGSTIWRHAFDAYVWATPVVADFDGDGERAIAIAGEGSTMAVLDRDGRPRWNRSGFLSGAITTMVSGNTDGDANVELVTTTTDGEVVAVDGSTGDVEWTRDLPDLTAVGGITTIDGDALAFVVASDGKLRAIDGATGATRWTTTLTTDDVQMMPAPRLGDVDGDGDPELVAATFDGFLTVVDPSTGSILHTYERSGTVRTAPELADVDGDGTDEVFVLYGDGRVVALEHESAE